MLHDEARQPLDLLETLNKYLGTHPEFLGTPIVDVNQRGALDSTALHICARKGMLELIQLLAESGASVDAVGDLGNTPLHEAAMAGKVESVRLLLALGASRVVKNEFGQTAKQVALLANHNQVASLL